MGNHRHTAWCQGEMPIVSQSPHQRGEINEWKYVQNDFKFFRPVTDLLLKKKAGVELKSQRNELLLTELELFY